MADDEELQKLWKLFGRDTEAGRALYKVYGAAAKPKINYPAVRTKKTPLPSEVKRGESAPSKTQIEYPPLKAPKRSKFRPIDFVPRRKPQGVIQAEIDHNYRDVKPSGKRGVNRQELTSNLQEKFQFSDGILPKSVIKSTGPPVPKPRHVPRPRPEDEIPNDTGALFDKIVGEIEERQAHLNHMVVIGQCNQALEQRIKYEIAERISDLQKIKEIDCRRE
jgi:hypothetical protein